MNFGVYSYSALIFIVALIPLIIFWSRWSKLLRKNIGFILKIGIFSVFYSGIADYFALNWRAWTFGEDKILGPKILNAPIEDFIFLFLAGCIIASLTVALMARYERI